MDVQFYTPRTVPENSEGLLKIQAGATWVYTDSFESFKKVTNSHVDLLISILEGSFIVSFKYVRYLTKADATLKNHGMEYIRFLVNLGCALDRAEKFLCRDAKDQTYAMYVAKSNVPSLRTLINNINEDIDRSDKIGIDMITSKYLEDMKGGYYCIKGILDHLRYLGILRGL